MLIGDWPPAPPRRDLIRILVVICVGIVGHFLWVQVSPWPWYWESAVTSVVMMPFALWYQRRYRDRWPANVPPFQREPKWHERWFPVIIAFTVVVIAIIFEITGWD